MEACTFPTSATGVQLALGLLRGCQPGCQRGFEVDLNSSFKAGSEAETAQCLG